MKILMVSMSSIHFFRWTEQLKDSGHDVYWFDILDGGYTNRLPWVKKYVGWKQKFPHLKGRHFLKKNTPRLYTALSAVIENNTAKTFENILEEIKPDVVHSFVLYISCVPILNIMQKYSKVKWIYSSWGSDLFYFKNIETYYTDIKKVLPRVNYLITDCKRDVELAIDLGFVGKVLGTFPGGGGYDIKSYEHFKVLPVIKRKIILVKGYQGRSGRSINVIKALCELKDTLITYEIVIFSADIELVEYLHEHKIFNHLNLRVYTSSEKLEHNVMLKLMGESLIYIGNSNSDGMPNTLLEAIIQGAFPIQSNPGGATSEIITHEKNGLLIEDCESIQEIKNHVNMVLSGSELISNAFQINQNEVKPYLDRAFITLKVLEAYLKIEL